VTPLVSDLDGKAKLQDGVLRNSWGVAFTAAGSPFWIADNGTGCSRLYDGTGAKKNLQVSIPLPGNVVPSTDCKQPPTPVAPTGTVNPLPTPAAPTGIIWNPSFAFVVPGTVSPANSKGIPAVFIFDTEDGTISAWAGGPSPPASAVIAVDNSKIPNAANDAVYKGLAFGVNVHGAFLFATNFRAGTIDVFGPPTPPGGVAPFGIQNIDGDLFVTYAQQNAQKHDDVAGRGHGFVDVFDTDGHLLRRFAARGELNSPWGVVRASFAFGRFSGDIRHLGRLFGPGCRTGPPGWLVDALSWRAIFFSNASAGGAPCWRCSGSQLGRRR